MRTLALIAARNLVQSRKRSLMLGSAIASVTLLLVLLGGLASGIQSTMLRAATTLATGHVNIGGFFKITTGQASPVVTRFEPLAEIARNEIPEVKLAVDRLRGWGRVVSRKQALQIGYLGVDIDAERDFHEILSITSGALDELRKARSVLLFESQAKRLDVAVGDKLTLSAPTFRGAYNSLDVTVVAIARDLGFISRFNVITDKATIREIYMMEAHTTGAIQLYLHDVDDADKVAERLRALLAERGHRIMEPEKGAFWMKFPIVTREDWTGQKLDISTWQSELQFLTWTLRSLDSITAALIAVLMIIIVVGVMNSLWMAIRERTREIGTLRAIGMGRAKLAAMFVIEAALLSVAATVVGALLGVAVAELLNVMDIGVGKSVQVFLMSDTLRMIIEPAAVVRAVVSISAITTVFAFYPAMKAARMPPITAIHNVG